MSVSGSVCVSVSGSVSKSMAMALFLSGSESTKNVQNVKCNLFFYHLSLSLTTVLVGYAP